MNKKILSLIIIFILFLTLSFNFTSNVNAATSSINSCEDNYDYILSQHSTLASGEITDSGYLYAHDDFKVYHTSDFYQYQYNNNCGPTLAANVLSYFRGTGYNKLYSGEITQSMYDHICSLVGYKYNGHTMLGSVYKAVKWYAENAGYKFKHDVYLLDTWSDVTRDIKLGYPVIANGDGHGYFVVGYRVIDGVRQLRVCTGWEIPEFTWIPFDRTKKLEMESMHIY